MGEFQLKGQYQTPHFENKAMTQDNFAVMGIVKKVYFDFETDSNGKTISPGTIEVDTVGKNKGNRMIAYPYNDLIVDLPLENEVVDIFYNGSVPTYRRLNLNATPNNGAVQAPPKTSAPGILINPTSYKTGGGFIDALKSIGDKLGSYFKDKKIHRLKLFEGDTIIQSKFGQSIRLSGYNNQKNDFNPTIVIRNKEAAKFDGVDVGTAIQEDINGDGGSIVLSSGEKNKIPFIPGTPDKLGGSDFKARPDKNAKILFSGTKDDYAFEKFPSSYEGNQCFITSDRLVFSSRKNETIFWSKGNYGVITDGIYSVDADNGININARNNNIDIQAHNQTINFHIGNTGEIRLGTIGNPNLKPAVDGTLLADILGKIVAEIVNLRNGGLLTPAGPVSGIDPTRNNELDAIAKQVPLLKSTKVFIQM